MNEKRKEVNMQLGERANCDKPAPEFDSGGIGSKMMQDSVAEMLRKAAIDSLTAYLIRLLEKKEFYAARRMMEALNKLT